MSIVKVQYVTPVHLRVVKCHHRVEENIFLEMKIPTMGSLQFMRKGALCTPTNYINCGIQHRNEPSIGRHFLDGQMADSGLLESAEAGPYQAHLKSKR